MQRQPVIFLLVFSLSLILAGFTTKHKNSRTVRIIQNESFIQKSRLPHSELYWQDSPTSASGFTAQKRQVNFLDHHRLQVCNNMPACVTILNENASVRPFKDYLFHIYPSHHFW